MEPGILGRKVGMTRVFSPEGKSVPVTVIEAGPCPILAVKNTPKDKYYALQIGYNLGTKRTKRHKPLIGLIEKAKCAPVDVLRELRLAAPPEDKAGDVINVEAFEKVKMVDVTGITKGRGFTGVVKRWNKTIGPKSHGSMQYRAPGSIGSSAWPSRVRPGRKMPGHYGCERVTVKNLDVVRIDKDSNLLFVRGAVPGANGGLLLIRKSKNLK
ncbi:MAG: 50S ribosomal protein L3 [Planctomycetota bacterium]|nr:50S ribosomal protein L3 [Planctomycetota bacterium]